MSKENTQNKNYFLNNSDECSESERDCIKYCNDKINSQELQIETKTVLEFKNEYDQCKLESFSTDDYNFDEEIDYSVEMFANKIKLKEYVETCTKSGKKLKNVVVKKSLSTESLEMLNEPLIKNNNFINSPEKLQNQCFVSVMSFSDNESISSEDTFNSSDSKSSKSFDSFESKTHLNNSDKPNKLHQDFFVYISKHHNKLFHKVLNELYEINK